jgi:hypothetical protein
MIQFKKSLTTNRSEAKIPEDYTKEHKGHQEGTKSLF